MVTEVIPFSNSKSSFNIAVLDGSISIGNTMSVVALKLLPLFSPSTSILMSISLNRR